MGDDRYSCWSSTLDLVEVADISGLQRPSCGPQLPHLRQALPLRFGRILRPYRIQIFYRWQLI